MFVLNKIVYQIKRIFANHQLKKKLLFTLAILLVFRLLAHIPVPFVDVEQLQFIFNQSQFLSFLNIFSGGTLVNFSVAAVGISPYISASIIIQLASMVIPQLKEMQKEGETERAKLNQYTRVLAVPLGIFQSISVLALLNSQNLLQSHQLIDLATMVITLVAGGMIIMWLGELISEYGLGNGISMVLFAGIASQIPVAIAETLSIASLEEYTILLTFIVVFLLVIALVVFMNEAVRKIPIQYAKRIRGSRVFGGQKSHLPVRVNVAGVMPIIFSVSIMMVPSFLSRFFVQSGKETLVKIGEWLTILSNQTSPFYMIFYFLLVFSFTFFSSLIFFNAEDLSEELKKSGAFVPGIRPGAATRKYLEFVVTRITLVGALFLGFIALLPSLAQMFTSISSLAIGGTSVLIVVSVVLETAKQVEGMLVGHNYEKYA